MAVGRPTKYKKQLAAEICCALGEGNSLVDICAAENMPTRSTIYLWLAEHKEFSDMYARAREEQADTLADEIVHIADTPMLGVKKKTGKDGTEITEGDMIEHRRLRVDARKWVAAKLKPKKYGDKIENTMQGPDGGALLVQVIKPA